MASILGIDLAWRGGNNTTAVSIAEIFGECAIHITKVHSNINNWQEAVDNKIITKATIGIAIDAPLVVNNMSGQRDCERSLSQEYGGRGASCHATNRTLYRNHDGISLSHKLKDHGFEHLNCKGKFQIECYPHPALIETFSLDYRVQYKKGSVNIRKAGQCKLADYIRLLEGSSVLKLTLSEETMHLLKHDYIHSLRGKALKQNEDALDSIICAYIAGLFHVGFHSSVFGSVTDGYIFIPKVKCI